MAVVHMKSKGEPFRCEMVSQPTGNLFQDVRFLLPLLEESLRVADAHLAPESDIHFERFTDEAGMNRLVATVWAVQP